MRPGFRRESLPLFDILPLRRRPVSIDNNSDFCDQRFLNSDYSRICSSKSVPKSGAASIYFYKLDRLARCAHNFSRRFTILWLLFPRFWLSYKMMVSIHLSRLLLTGASVTLRGSGCSDFGHGFMSEYVSTNRRESVLARALFNLTNNL